MFDRLAVSAELEEQRCLIEQQHVEIRRQQRQIQLQAQLTAVIQAELDAIRVTLRPKPQSMLSSQTHSNGQHTARRLRREAMPSGLRP